MDSGRASHKPYTSPDTPAHLQPLLNTLGRAVEQLVLTSGASRNQQLGSKYKSCNPSMKGLGVNEYFKSQFTANEPPLLALQWPTRILCRNLNFLRKIGTSKHPICQNPTFPFQKGLTPVVPKLETYLGTNFTMPVCEAILKSPQAESIPDPKISTTS